MFQWNPDCWLSLQYNCSCKLFSVLWFFIVFLNLNCSFQLQLVYSFLCSGLFKKKFTLSKIYFTKTTDAKSVSCVWLERKSLKVLNIDLKWCITEAVAAVTCGMLWQVWEGLDYRFDICRITWCSHWVLVRCENSWEFSLQSINSTSPYV
jgi:hypothetical protein